MNMKFATCEDFDDHLGLQLQRLREEAANQQTKAVSLEEDLSQARKVCDVWRCKALMAEQQRDEVLSLMILLF